MKLNVEFEALWSNARKMGAEPVDIDLDYEWDDGSLELDTLLSSTGIEIDLSEISGEEGLLNYKGRQVLLYIPDHGSSVERAISKPDKGNKFHVAECNTLEDMRQRNRFDRYKVTNNIEGVFDVYGTSKHNGFLEGRAALNVCKFCINKLNYKNAANTTVQGRNNIVANFGLDEFFSTYSSIFKYYPKTNVKDAKRGYSNDWDNISRNVRKDAGYHCGHCKVSLNSNKNLLHTHHLNGEKSDNRVENLIPLCADCHRKQPFHQHMHVKHSEVKLINHLRREQGLLVTEDWADVFKFADPACHGVLSHCQKNGYSFPEIAFEAKDDNGKKLADVELAWPHKKTAMVLDNTTKIEGWRLFGLEKATEFFG